ncbi:hypothetical protein KNE206_29530 [Kitasatospora sp. NE20-6]
MQGMGSGVGGAVVDTVAGAAESPKEYEHPIFRLQPKEDDGSRTAGLFRYQAEAAARFCLAMLTQESIDYVVCEWHEDFVIAFSDGAVELVSVKHRQHDQGAWTIPQLCKDGGLAHLFDRWLGCGRASNMRLRLFTSAALNPARDNARGLAKMCGPDPELTVGRDAMVRAVARQLLKVRWKQPYDNIPETPVVKVDDIVLPEGFVDQVDGFLVVLAIDHDQSPDHSITDTNIQQFLLPAIARLELDQVDTEATYRDLVNRIEKANRDESDRGQLAAHIVDPSRVLHDRQMQARIARRRLHRDTVLEEFVYQRTAVPTYARGQVPIDAPGGARLGRKLARGQVPSDEAAHAERLRSAWYVAWSQQRSGLAGDAAALENLKLEVADTVFECRGSAEEEAAPGAAYGRRMNQLLAQQLTPEAMSARPPFKVNKLHLRGLAYQLADDCLFYFSEPFDASAEGAS